MNKKKSKSSQQWLARQRKDEFVQKAKAEGYRSRAAYKLLELQDKYKIIKQGDVVVDIGAAPGGWSQIAAKLAGNKGYVLAIDILPIEQIENVDIIKGDFTEESVYQELLHRLDNRKVNVVISDIAPNLSGIRSSDQAKAMYLSELALDFAISVLAPKGKLVVKVFQGEGFDNYLIEVKRHFSKVMVRKPKSSRSESREVYIIASDFK